MPLPGLVGLLHVRLEVRDRRLHHLGGLEHERQLHLPRPEQLADHLHAVQQRVVDDVQGLAGLERLVEVGLQAVLLAVDDAALEALVQRQRGQFLGLARLQRLRRRALEQLHELLQRVVALGTPVVDQVESGPHLLLAEPGDREDLAGVHDRRVQTRLHALVQEHAVQQDAGGRVQTEGDVRQTQCGLHVRVTALQLTDALDRGDAVLAGLLLTGADRERQTVHEDVLLTDAPVPGQVRDQAFGDFDLLLRRPRLPLLVDRQRDQRRTVLPRQLGDARETRLGAVAVLVVHRVDHRAAAQHLQTRPDHLHLGGVQHHRQRGRGREPPRQLPHVRHTVTAHVVHAQVQHVRALTDLLPRHLHAVVPPALQHGLAELLRPVGVGALTDRQVGGVLPERHTLVQRRRTRLRARVALHRGQLPHPLHQPPQMLRRRAAAAAHQRQPVLPHERLLRVRQLGRGQRVVGAVLGQLGQAGVRHARQGDAGVARQVAQVLAHLGGAGRTVQADHVDAQRLQRGQGGADLGAEQHGAGGLHRHRHDQRNLQADGPRMARRAAMTDALVWSRSCVVSTSRASAPPASRPSAFCW